MKLWSGAKGSTRIVLIVPILGIVLKFPRIYWKVIWFFIRERPRFLFTREYWNPSAAGSIGQALVSGLHANWTERRFWKRTRNQFVQPTWFSLFGLVNIQPISLACPALSKIPNFSSSRGGLCKIAQEITGIDWTRSCGHEFVEPSNFGLYRGHLRMRDYGGLKVQSFLGPYGQAMSEVLRSRYGL